MEKKYENIVELVKDIGLTVKDVQGDNTHGMLLKLINLLCKKILEMEDVIWDLKEENRLLDRGMENYGHMLDSFDSRISCLSDR